MSFSYALFGKRKPKPTMEYKSQLESIVADWLVSEKIPYIYEPKTFQTQKGKYTPDFYLTEINTFIEVKPTIEAITESYKNLLEQFVIEQKADLYILTPQGEITYLEYNINEGLDKWCNYKIIEDGSAYIGKCNKCGTKFLSSVVGSYHCRKCNFHNGDHDIYGWAERLFRNYHEDWQQQNYGRVFK